MPTSATGNSGKPPAIMPARPAQQAPRTAGFSLVEMLVVLAIMALAASVVLLNAGPRGQSLAAETDRLAVHLSAARDLALTRNRAVRVEIGATGYIMTVQSRLGWTPPDRTGAIIAWQEGTTVSAPPEALPLQIVFDSIGIASAGEVILDRNGETQSIRIDASGAIAREAGHGA
jgi:general secretion pathway protein H